MSLIKAVDDVPFATAAAPAGPRLVGHQQGTDAYLLDLALKRGGVLATLVNASRR